MIVICPKHKRTLHIAPPICLQSCDCQLKHGERSHFCTSFHALVHRSTPMLSGVQYCRPNEFQEGGEGWWKLGWGRGPSPAWEPYAYRELQTTPSTRILGAVSTVPVSLPGQVQAQRNPKLPEFSLQAAALKPAAPNPKSSMTFTWGARPVNASFFFHDAWPSTPDIPA